jgi:hypothetical protein
MAPHRLGRCLRFLLCPIKGESEPHLSPQLLSASPRSRAAPSSLKPGAPPPTGDPPAPISSFAASPAASISSVSSLASSLPLEPILVPNRARDLDFEFSGEPRQRAPPGATAAGRLPAARCLHVTGAVRLARTAQIKKGGVPLDRSTVDRWTRSTGAGPRATSCLRQRQPIAARHVAPPQPLRRPPRRFCKKNPAVSKITNIPFHLYNSLSSRSLFLCLEP